MPKTKLFDNSIETEVLDTYDLKVSKKIKTETIEVSKSITSTSSTVKQSLTAKTINGTTATFTNLNVINFIAIPQNIRLLLNKFGNKIASFPKTDSTAYITVNENANRIFFVNGTNSIKILTLNQNNYDIRSSNLPSTNVAKYALTDKTTSRLYIFSSTNNKTWYSTDIGATFIELTYTVNANTPYNIGDYADINPSNGNIAMGVNPSNNARMLYGTSTNWNILGDQVTGNGISNWSATVPSGSTTQGKITITSTGTGIIQIFPTSDFGIRYISNTTSSAAAIFAGFPTNKKYIIADTNKNANTYILVLTETEAFLSSNFGQTATNLTTSSTLFTQTSWIKFTWCAVSYTGKYMAIAANNRIWYSISFGVIFRLLEHLIPIEESIIMATFPVSTSTTDENILSVVTENTTESSIYKFYLN